MAEENDTPELPFFGGNCSIYKKKHLHVSHFGEFYVEGMGCIIYVFLLFVIRFFFGVVFQLAMLLRYLQMERLYDVIKLSEYFWR